MSTVDLRFLLDDQARIIRPVSPNGSCNCTWADGLSFFDVISNPSLREIFRMLIEGVRKTGKELRLTLRCDTPELRREAYVTARLTEVDGAKFIEIENGTLSTTPRAPVPLLDPAVPRDESFLSICSWCKRLRHGEDWIEIEEAVPLLGLFDRPRLPNITHGLCPECQEKLLASIPAWKTPATARRAQRMRDKGRAK